MCAVVLPAVAPSALSARAADTPSAAAGGLASAATGERPRGRKLVILNDGRFFAGALSSDRERRTITLTTDSGKQVFPFADVSAAIVPAKDEDDGYRHLFRGDDTGSYLAWKAWLDQNHLTKRGGKKFEESEKAARDAYRTDVVEAVKQCTEWKTWSAAGALLGDALDLGVWDDEVQEAALASIPDIDDPECFGFSSEDEEKTKLWAKWSKAIIPLGGSFVNKLSHPRKAATPAHWLNDAVVLQTRNIELWSKERDKLAIVCEVLRQAESTVRGLEHLLGMPETGNDEKITVRLCEDRTRYLLDIGPGGRPPDWSAGFFSPGDGISRFYISGTADMRETVSHELTHHWLERRYLRGGDRYPKEPGYWIVEGFARFVEHQCFGFQKGKYGFDNPGVESVAATIHGRSRGTNFPCGTLVDLSQYEFGQSVTADMTKLQAFYQQSGALVYFMMNARGEDGRKRLVAYMKSYYAGDLWDAGKMNERGTNKVDPEKGKPVLGAWKALGFATAEELDREFNAWLSDPTKAKK